MEETGGQVCGSVSLRGDLESCTAVVRRRVVHEPIASAMTPLPPQTSEPVPPRRWRWGRLVLLALVAGIGALGWHIYTGQRAKRQLREAGFEANSEPWPGARVWEAARQDWRLVFKSATWESIPPMWRLDGAKAGELRNLDAVAPALRRVNPGQIFFVDCTALENVDGLKGLAGLQILDFRNCAALQNVGGLKGLTGLQWLNLSDCNALQNVDGLKGLTGLKGLYLSGCRALQNVDGLKGVTGLKALNLFGCTKIPASALRELRSAHPKTVITFPSGSMLPPQ